MTSGQHIIVCDDEADIRDMVREYLEMQGYRVSEAGEGKALRELIEMEPVHLVLLDINMPGEDGLSLARFLRERGNVSIIMMTAAGEVVDKIIGLEMGADDYMAKPVDLREMLARVKSVLRRNSKPDQAATDPGKTVAQIETARFGKCMLDVEARKLQDANGDDIPITAMEYALLKVFSQNPGRVLNRDQLLEQAHDRNWDPFDRSIDIRISRLRKKIEIDPTKPEIIKTVRGIGYVYAAD